MTDDAGEHGEGDEDTRSMSTRMDDMEDRMDLQNEDIRELRENLENHLDTIDSRIRGIESGAADVESVRKLYEYMIDLEEQISTRRDRLEAALDEELPDK